MLYAGAAVLVTGVIQTTAMHRLPIPLLGDDGESLQQIAAALAVAMGTLGTLLLLAIYLPAAQILRTRALELAAGATGVRQPSKLEGWLRERGMESSLPQQLTRLTAVLAPFLAGGPLMAALRAWLGARPAKTRVPVCSKRRFAAPSAPEPPKHQKPGHVANNRQ